MYSSIWSAEDIESGLANDVTVKIGSYPGGDDIHNGSQSMANYIRRELNTSEGMSTYVTIEAENRAGLVVVAYSEPVALDTTLPPRGEVSEIVSGWVGECVGGWVSECMSEWVCE